MSIYQLQGKTAIVTGSGRAGGIGEAVVMRFAAEGCNVVISDLAGAVGENFPGSAIGSTQEMERIAEECRKHGVKAITVPCDVRKEADMANLVEQAAAAFGSVDIFVNNAGVGYLMQLVTEMDEEKWSAVMDVNVKGYFLGIKHAGKRMIAQSEAGKKGGRIINIGSQASKSGFPFAAAYTASKHAVVGLTRASAIELAKYGYGWFNKQFKYTATDSVASNFHLGMTDGFISFIRRIPHQETLAGISIFFK